MRNVRRALAWIVRSAHMEWNARRRTQRRLGAALLVAAALGLELSSGCGVDPLRPEPPPAGYLVGYVAGWEAQREIPAAKLHAVNFAFAHVVDGRVVLDQPGAGAALARVVLLKQANPKLKVLISVGGWGADGFSDAAASEASRSVFADSAADLLLRTHTDGIDIDWEYPGLPGPGIKYRGEDRQNFTALLHAMHARFIRLSQEQERPYLLTAALADGEFVAHVELQQLDRYLNWINLMTYDFHNSLTMTTGHHAALVRSATSSAAERSVESAVEQLVAGGVSPGHIVVGVPFYGRAFAEVRDDNHGLDQPYGRYAGDYPWPKLKSDYIDRNGFTRHWDETAKVPYLWNAQTHEFISYDDPQSLALKACYVKARGLLGMMYWEQSHDPDGELVDVLARNLR